MLTRRQSQLTLIGMSFRGTMPKTKEEIEKEIEKRALDTSLTTTATTFVTATANVNGVNNGGQLIPTKLILDVLREDGALSSVLADLAPTYIAGATAVPYRSTRTSAYAKAEGSDVYDAQWQWAQLALSIGKLQTQLVITDELADMTEFDLGEYVVQTLESDFAEDWDSEIIYGTGTDNHVSGITNGLTATTYSAGAELATIETLVTGVKGKYRRGAKVYMSQSAYDGVVFAKDSNGDYLINPINNPQGVQSFTNLPVVVDENMTDGDIFVGNVARFYKINMLQPMKFETERHATEGTTTYVVNQRAGGKAVPNAFKYGKLSA